MANPATNKIRTGTDNDLAKLTGLYSVGKGVSAVLRVPVSEALDKYTILLQKRDALVALLKRAEDDDKVSLKSKLASIKKQLSICTQVYKQVKKTLRSPKFKTNRVEFDRQFAALSAANNTLWNLEEEYLQWYRAYVSSNQQFYGGTERIAQLSMEIRAGNLERSTAKYAIDALLDKDGLSETKIFKAHK